MSKLQKEEQALSPASYQCIPKPRRLPKQEKTICFDTSWRSSSPAKPIPDSRIKPDDRLTKQHVSGSAPSRRDLAAAFHAGSHCAIGVRHCNPCIKHARLALCFRFRANHGDLAVKRPHGVAVQFDGRLLANAQLADIGSIDRNVNDSARSVHHFGKGIAELQPASGERVDMRRCNHAVDRRAKLRSSEQFLGSRLFTLPVIRLHALNSAFTTIVCSERMIHLQQRGPVLRFRGSQGRPQIPCIHLSQDLPALYRFAFVDEYFAHYAFKLWLHLRALAGSYRCVPVDPHRQRKYE